MDKCGHEKELQNMDQPKIQKRKVLKEPVLL